MTNAECAPVAQLDRASDFESEGWGFKSLQARQLIATASLVVIVCFHTVSFRRENEFRLFVHASRVIFVVKES